MVAGVSATEAEGEAAAWATVTVAPATPSVPERDAPLLLAMPYVTVPLPEPLAPVAMLSQVALLVAVHVQPAPAVTETLAEPPAAVAL
jgi:hypothetical protein